MVFWPDSADFSGFQNNNFWNPVVLNRGQFCDTFGCHDRGGGATGMWPGGARDVVAHSTAHGPPPSPTRNYLAQNVRGAEVDPRDKKLQQRPCYLWYVQCIKIIISLNLKVSVALSCTPHSTPWIFYNNSLAVSPDGDSSATLLAEFNFMPLYNELYMLNNWLIKLPPWPLISLVGI